MIPITRSAVLQFRMQAARSSSRHKDIFREVNANGRELRDNQEDHGRK